MLPTLTAAHPVHPLIAARRSPYQYSSEPVDEATLQVLFEAARWAASAYNEQPWSYIVARREDGDAYAKLLSCLVEGNQPWAGHAPVLALGLIHTTFTRNGKPNDYAAHDLGAASAQLTFQASAHGLYVHQMAGIIPERARELYHLPADWQAFTGLAIGKLGNPAGLPEPYRERDTITPSRKPLADFVFTGDFGTAAPFLG